MACCASNQSRGVHRINVEATPAHSFASSSGRAGESQARSALQTELSGLKQSALLRRAKVSGVADEALEEAMDSDTPREAVVALLVAAEWRRQRLGAGEDAPKVRSCTGLAKIAQLGPTS